MLLQTAVVVVVGTIMVLHWYLGIQKTTKPKSDTTTC